MQYATLFLVVAVVYCCMYYSEFSPDPPCRRCSRFTSHPFPHALFNVVCIVAFFLVLLYTVNVVLWVLLLALIQPEKFVHIIVGIVAAAFTIMALFRRAYAMSVGVFCVPAFVLHPCTFVSSHTLLPSPRRPFPGATPSARKCWIVPWPNPSKPQNPWPP